VKPILDACCGGRMFWFDKTTPGVVFMDCRTLDPVEMTNRQTFTVQPDVIGDFRSLPFPDAAFRLVVFDPPHIDNLAPSAYLAMKYGVLLTSWREDIRAGFRECLRVLDPGGFLIFKWAETRIPLAEVLQLAPHPPLFGNRSGKSSHWMTFAQSGEVMAA
jgi:SAM-dependent methyltransferase